MVSADVERAVGIHLQSFSGFFLTFLGERFLRTLYSEILNEEDHVALVAHDPGNHLLGFVVGVEHQAGFYKRLAREQWFAFAVSSFGALVRRPSILPRLIRALAYSSNVETASAQALLMSLAVLPSTKGLGIGKALVYAFLDEMKARNVRSVSLTTDASSNHGVNKFYGELGFTIARTYVTREDRQMNEYVIHQ
jgi:ribosomal protein S18 acetylase RimI-like enzyme